MGKLSLRERTRILSLLNEGKSQNAVARESGRSVGIVNAIARESGLEYSRPKNAAAVLQDYSLAERLKLINRFFIKAGELLDGVETSSSLRELATALAILVDKRRLEDGEATAVTETRSADLTRERLVSRVDELASRRGAKAATG